MTKLPETSRLFQTIKDEALPGVWSQGVKLARMKSVEVESSKDDELVLRVPTPGRAIAPTAVLYPKDLEWTCDCAGRNDPCEHAVASVIALHQNLLGQTEPGTAANLCYRLSIERQRIRIRRFIQSSTGERELEESLTSMVARGTCPIIPTEDDIKVDRLLMAVPRGDFNLGQVQRLIGALETLNVEFEGTVTRVRREPVKPEARLFDDGEWIVLEVRPSRELRDVLAPGVAFTGEIRPLGAVEISGLRAERLPLVRRVRVGATAELVDKILPELEKFVEVRIETRRLPERSQRQRPWVQFDLSHHGHTLSVLPILVYGKPVVARVDHDQLHLLGNTAPRRDRAMEHNLIEHLRDRLNLVPGRRVHFDGEEAARFAQRLRNFEFETEASDPSAGLGHIPQLEPRLTLDPATFSVAFVANEGGADGSASAEAVLRAYRDGVELVPLSGGGFGALPLDWLSRHGAQVAQLLAARDARGKLPTFAMPALAKFCEAVDAPPPAEFERLAPLFRGFEALPPLALPEDLEATLRPYQVDAVRWLAFLRDAELGAVLADDMGLGKTLQTLCNARGRMLVVCPRSVIFNWEREIARFRPNLRSSVYHGPGRALNEHADITLTTYSVLRLDVDLLAAVAWDQCVLDEAQAIKNPGSQTAKAAFQLQSKFRLALSGTPIENRLEELWSIFRFTHPGLLGALSDFDEQFARPIAAGNQGSLDRLRELTRPFLLRRLKKEVAKDLPPRTDVILPIELDAREREVYDAVLAATKSEVVEALQQGGSVMRALEALLRLRQAACHIGLLPGNDADQSTKTEALMDALEDVTLDGHKALVFSQWTSFLDRIEPHLDRAEIPFLRLDGSTRDRGSVVERFQDPSGPPVLLASLKAGGTGLNLTAADHVFIMDPWYNPATEDQAADRAHRIGQDQPVMVYRVVARNTVEEGIVSLQESKRRLAENALEGTAGAVAITRDDLLALLS